jgi:hypothetical protein
MKSPAPDRNLFVPWRRAIDSLQRTNLFPTPWLVEEAAGL